VLDCQFALWIVDQLDGPHIALMELSKNHTLREPKDVHNLLERFRQTNTYLMDHISNLREGRSLGLTAANINIKHVIDQLESQLAEDPKSSPFAVAEEKMPPTLTKKQKSDYAKELLTVVSGVVYPALRAYRDYLK